MTVLKLGDGQNKKKSESDHQVHLEDPLSKPLEDSQDDEEEEEDFFVFVQEALPFLSFLSPAVMIAWILNTIKAIVFTFLSVVQTVLCCCRKTKKSGNRFGEPSDVLSGPPLGNDASDMSSWDRWGEDQPSEIVIGGGNRRPDTVEDHIKAYRDSLQEMQRKKSTPEEPEAVVEPDLFAELAPTVKKQKKLYVGRGGAGKAAQERTSRLNVQENMADPLLAMGDELADWESSQSGWQAEEDDLGEVLREQRRHQKQRLDSM